MKKVEITPVNSETIIALAQKDLEKFQANEKSYRLINWLKDELILLEIHKKNTIQMNAKAFSRCINILALLRERNLNSLTCNIQDKDTVIITFSFDLTTLGNAERRRLNNEYDLNLEEITEDEIDETYAHFLG